jgi:hypothetical protein
VGWTADSEFPADIALQVDEHGHDAHVVTESPSRIVAGRRGVGVAHMINRDEGSGLVTL